jgi:WD40 repeat protein
MDWTTPLRSLQADFIKRLRSDSAILHHLIKYELRGYYSELTVVLGEELDEIRKYCWYIADKYKKISKKTVYDDFINNLKGKLGEILVKKYLGNFVTPIDLKERLYGDGKIDFRLTSDPTIGIQVKARHASIDTVKWSISSEEVEKNAVLVCIYIQEEVSEAQPEYNLILAGFLPTNMMRVSNGKASVGINELLYGGGLKTYLESLQSERFTSNLSKNQWERKQMSVTRESWRCLHTLTGHSTSVLSVVISPDSQTLASTSISTEVNRKTIEDIKIIKLWHLGMGQEITTLKSNTKDEFLAFSSGGQTLFSSGSDDKTIKLSQTGTVQEFRTIKGYAGWFRCLAISPDGQTTASSGGWNKFGGKSSIKLWQLSTGQELHTLEGHRDYVRSIAFSPDGQTLASGSDDKTIKLWQVSTGQEICTLKGHTDWVFSVAFSPDGQTLASGSDDETIKLWQVSTGQEICTLRGHTNYVHSVAFSPDGQILASGSNDKTIKLWQVSTGHELFTFTGHTESVNSVAFSPNGQILASGSTDKTIKIWRQEGWYSHCH